MRFRMAKHNSEHHQDNHSKAAGQREKTAQPQHRESAKQDKARGHEKAAEGHSPNARHQATASAARAFASEPYKK